MHTLSRRTFVTGSFGTALTLALGACGSSTSGTTSSSTSESAASYSLVESGKILVASDLANPPLDSTNEKTGEPEGFEVDLMVAIAE